MDKIPMLELALGSFVTYNPKSISSDTSAGDALDLMDRLGIHHLPVVDDGRRVVGIVSHRDLVALRSGCLANSIEFERRSVSRAMVKTVFTIDCTASPKAALQAILDYGFHSVPVLEEGSLVGMITSTDFLRELSYGELSACDDLVADHMLTLTEDDLLFSAATETDALVEESSVIGPDQSLAVAAGLMLEFNVREIAVVDDLCRPIGVLRDDDILRAIAGRLT